MPDFSLYEAGGQRHAPVPHVGLVISTCGSSPTIHLQLEQACRMFGSHTSQNTGMPVLVVNDGDTEEDELRALCEQYQACYLSGPKLGHAPGDLRAFLIGLEWCEQHNIQIMAKMSRRFVPTVEWRTELLWLADQNRYACAFGRKHDERGFLRTDCIALRVDRWNVPEIRNHLQEAIDFMPDTLSVETIIGSTVRVNGGFAEWHLLGEHISRPHDRALQWRALYPYNYGDLSRSLGLPYCDTDFEKGVFVSPPAKREERPEASSMAETLHRVRPDRYPMVTACDDQMVDMAVVLARSIDHHAPDFFSRRYCMVDGISDAGRDALAQEGYIVLDSPDTGCVADFGSVPNNAALLRCLVPGLMPDTMFCYLDADTLVTGPLDSLNDAADAMMENNHGTAAFEYYRPDYFNAGVLLVNTPVWTEKKIGPTALHLYREMRNDGTEKSGEVPYDEVAMNRAFVPHGVTVLPEKFNATPCMLKAPDATIVHFRGPKPCVASDRERFSHMLGGMFDHYEGIWKHERTGGKRAANGAGHLV